MKLHIYLCDNYFINFDCYDLFWQSFEGDVKELSLDFTVTEESFGKRHVIELKHGGKDISVTNENKMQYVHAIADYKLNRQVTNCLSVTQFLFYLVLIHI